MQREDLCSSLQQATTRLYLKNCGFRGLPGRESLLPVWTETFSAHVRVFLAVVVISCLYIESPEAHTGTDHVAEDENAAQLAQGYAPFEVAPETINVPLQSDFDVLGSWGPVINWPHIPVSAANLADGRVLTWASNLPNDFPGGVE